MNRGHVRRERGLVTSIDQFSQYETEYSRPVTGSLAY